MATRNPDDKKSEEFWRDYLTHPDTLMATGRRFFSRLPANPDAASARRRSPG